MKQILKKAPILFLISFSLIGCTSKEQRLLKDVEKHSGIKYLTASKIIFSYSKITGFEDQAGPVYYVLDYTNSDKKDEFVSLYFKNNSGKNSDFETKVDEFIEEEILGAYTSFEEQYKLDFDKPYSYYSSDKLFLIYYQETSTAYFLYHLWIP